MNDDEAFARLVHALRPWHEQLIFVGGWAHYLHRRHPLASVPTLDPIRTRDADVAFAPKARLLWVLATPLPQPASERSSPGTIRHRSRTTGSATMTKGSTPSSSRRSVGAARHEQGKLTRRLSAPALRHCGFR